MNDSDAGTSRSVLRILFAGTPDFAAASLQALIDAHYNLIGVYTQPDRPAGRGRKLTPSPVKQRALAADLPLFQPATLKSVEAQNELARLQPDVMVVAAYGLLLPEAVLRIPRHGCLNVHASLLPRWRGAAPIHRAILAGDTETGITIMQMDKGLDTGAMLYKRSLSIRPDDTTGSLHNRLAHLGADCLLHTLSLLESGHLHAENQDERYATYAAKLSKAEGCINWCDDAPSINRKIRAFNPNPVAYSFHEGHTVRIWDADTLTDASALFESKRPGTVLRYDANGLLIKTGTGLLNITKLQLPGKKPLNVQELCNGRPDLFKEGQCFGQEPGF